MDYDAAAESGSNPVSQGVVLDRNKRFQKLVRGTPLQTTPFFGLRGPQEEYFDTSARSRCWYISWSIPRSQKRRTHMSARYEDTGISEAHLS